MQKKATKMKIYFSVATVMQNSKEPDLLASMKRSHPYLRSPDTSFVYLSLILLLLFTERTLIKGFMNKNCETAMRLTDNSPFRQMGKALASKPFAAAWANVNLDGRLKPFQESPKSRGRAYWKTAGLVHDTGVY